MEITGAEIRAARERAGLTQQELGERVGVGQRTVGNWERGETVPRNRTGRLRAVLADHLDDRGHHEHIRAVSDAEVVAEIARRMSVAREERDHGRDTPATTRAGGSPADVEAARARVFQVLEEYWRDADRAWTRSGASQEDRKDELDRLRKIAVTQITQALDGIRPSTARDVG